MSTVRACDVLTLACRTKVKAYNAGKLRSMRAETLGDKEIICLPGKPSSPNDRPLYHRTMKMLKMYTRQFMIIGAGCPGTRYTAL